MGADRAEEARSRLAIALDVDDIVAATRLARQLRPWFGVAKVGLELYTAVGPDAIGAMLDLGYRVFADMKLHDIPTTVSRAARVLGALGAGYVTLHTAGGADMLAAGVDGFQQGASEAGLETEPIGLGVTVLTSEVEAKAELLTRRAARAANAGCGGVICAAGDIATVRAAAAGLLCVTPGIRPAGTTADDQKRVATPAAAIAAGASLLVVGRPVTAAGDPEAAAAALHDEVAAAL